MEIVIKIPEEKYNEIHSLKFVQYGLQSEENKKFFYLLINAIQDGTPIDKYEPCITMSKAFANSVASVKMLEDENEELKNKINNIITEITHTGVQELKMHGQTDFYSGVHYCINTFDRNGLTVNKINKESEE